MAKNCRTGCPPAQGHTRTHRGHRGTHTRPACQWPNSAHKNEAHAHIDAHTHTIHQRTIKDTRGVCLYWHVCMCVCVNVCARTHTHTHTQTHTHTRMSSTEETCKVRTSAVETPLMHMTVSAPVREQIKVYMTTYRFLTASRKEKRANTTPALTGGVQGHGMQAIGFLNQRVASRRAYACKHSVCMHERFSIVHGTRIEASMTIRAHTHRSFYDCTC